MIISATYPRPEPPAPDLSDEARARGAARLAVLAELAEIGMVLARDLRRQAEAAAEAGQEPPADLGLKFARIARAVRQTLALEARLEEAGALAAAQAAGRAQRQAAAQREHQAAARRDEGEARRYQAGAAVERLFDPCDDEAFERLENALCDWMLDADADDLADKSVAEIVLAICRDLEITPDWSLWADEPWAQAAEGAARGSPASTGPPQPRSSPACGAGAAASGAVTEGAAALIEVPP